METIKTRDFGEVTVSKDSLITFKKPIFGFEDLTEFYLLQLEEPSSFYLLQSKDEPNISFILTEPRQFISDYVLDIDDSDAGLLEFADHSDLIDFAIVTIPENIEEMTMNILGPVVINTKNRFGIQSISNCTNYGTKCRLFLPQAVSAETR